MSATKQGRKCPAFDTYQSRAAPRPGVYFALQRISFGADQRQRAPGYSADQATAALEDVFKQTMPREMGFDYSGMSFQEQKSARRCARLGYLRTVVAIRLSDSGGFV